MKKFLLRYAKDNQKQIGLLVAKDVLTGKYYEVISYNMTSIKIVRDKLDDLSFEKGELNQSIVTYNDDMVKSISKKFKPTKRKAENLIVVYNASNSLGQSYQKYIKRNSFYYKIIGHDNMKKKIRVDESVPYKKDQLEFREDINIHKAKTIMFEDNYMEETFIITNGVFKSIIEKQPKRLIKTDCDLNRYTFTILDKFNEVIKIIIKKRTEQQAISHLYKTVNVNKILNIKVNDKKISHSISNEQRIGDTLKIDRRIIAKLDYISVLPEITSRVKS